MRWIISEDKILDIVEIDLLSHSCQQRKKQGIKEKKFYLVRDWFIIELGLLTGLRVDEMRQLKIGDIHIRGSHSSIFVQNGKGGQKPYNKDHSTSEKRWEEIARICSEIIAEHGF
ncbi:MAG: hypothetical protein K8S27_05195 [Candidatus Omnitrophica bacterium]|nr:hypothetical protein [Candidatus Omnitrophota bacterium]